MQTSSVQHSMSVFVTGEDCGAFWFRFSSLLILMTESRILSTAKPNLFAKPNFRCSGEPRNECVASSVFVGVIKDTQLSTTNVQLYLVGTMIPALNNHIFLTCYSDLDIWTDHYIILLLFCKVFSSADEFRKVFLHLQFTLFPPFFWKI